MCGLIISSNSLNITELNFEYVLFTIDPHKAAADYTMQSPDIIWTMYIQLILGISKSYRQ